MANIKCSECGVENLDNAKYCAGCGKQLSIPQPERPSLPPLPPLKPKKSQWPVIIGAIIGGIIFWSVAYVVNVKYVRPIAGKKTIELIAFAANKSCPTMIDEQTRLDNITAPQDNTLQYNYTLMQIEKATIDTEKLRSALEQQLIENTKTMPEMKALRELKTTVIYNYRDKNGEFLYELKVTSDMYE